MKVCASSSDGVWVIGLTYYKKQNKNKTKMENLLELQCLLHSGS